MLEAMAVTPHPSHGHFAAFGHCAIAASLLWTNDSHTVYDQVFHGRLPQQNDLGPSDTILSSTSLRSSRDEGRWVIGDYTPS